MDENSINSKRNTGILLARNSPVALVVGAASFLGSHLSDRLLSKNIQVIGVDDLGSGRKENLTNALKDKNFHFIIADAENLNLDISRLDYIFIVSEIKPELKNILDLFEKFKARLLLISSVELYGEETPDRLVDLKRAESEVARHAKENNLNARVLRLGPVFGPRMDFKEDDGLTKLIRQALLGNLQRTPDMDFSSRALFIDDAVELIVKCIFAGATAQKIFDGVLPVPIKVSEIKQILIDPLWYQNRGFKPTELPPWSTPNLKKTIKFLNWHPGGDLVESLRKTLSYFEDNEITIPKMEKNTYPEEKKIEPKDLKEEAPAKKEEKTRSIKIPKLTIPVSKISLLLAVFLIGYALVWPFLNTGVEGILFGINFSQAVGNFKAGNLNTSLKYASKAESNLKTIQAVENSFDILGQTGILKEQLRGAGEIINLASISVDSLQNAALGAKSLSIAFRGITGESGDSVSSNLTDAKTYLEKSNEDLSKIKAQTESIKPALPIFKQFVQNALGNLPGYSDSVKKLHILSIMLPDIVAPDGKKTYLVLLQNNNDLRPGGGIISSVGRISFEKGMLEDISVDDVSSVDSKLNISVEPPKEIKDDLGQSKYLLRDSNWEPDLPTAARQEEWFYNKETGERISGVFVLDTAAIEDIIKAMGSLSVSAYNEKLTGDNISALILKYSRPEFFNSGEEKKSFLSSVLKDFLDKIFFLPNQNWPAIALSLDRSITQKHAGIYFDDVGLFSYASSLNWTNIMPRPSKDKEEGMRDFLSAVEANMGENEANYYLDRSYNLETTIGKDGAINQRLRISYSNKSSSNSFPQGSYKNRMRIYFPFGAKLERVLWGESDITSKVSSFVDYGRSGYSFLINLQANEQKTLVLDYQLPEKLAFVNGKANYKLDIIKQAGTLNDPFIWTINFPLGMKLASSQSLSPQQKIIRTDLSKDRSFELTFEK